MCVALKHVYGKESDATADHRWLRKLDGCFVKFPACDSDDAVPLPKWRANCTMHIAMILHSTGARHAQLSKIVIDDCFILSERFVLIVKSLYLKRFVCALC